MKVLVLVAFVVLGCSLAGARNVTKCELKQQLMVVFNSLPNNVTLNGLTEKAFLAKVACHMEHHSGFNTSAVTYPSHGTGKESQEDSSESGSSKSEAKGKKNGKGKDKGKGTGKEKSSESNKHDVDATLYGLFQLPEDLVCSSANRTSLNLCGISCNKLTDDDISDDIVCMVKLISELVTKHSMAKNSVERWEVVKDIVGDNCKNVDQYFSGC